MTEEQELQIKQIKARLLERRRGSQISEARKPRYDEVFFQGVAWLDSRAADPDEWEDQ